MSKLAICVVYGVGILAVLSLRNWLALAWCLLAFIQALDLNFKRKGSL